MKCFLLSVTAHREAQPLFKTDTINRLAVADEKNPGVWGDSELIAIDPKTHELLGGHDNRRNYGKADGY